MALKVDHYINNSTKQTNTLTTCNKLQTITDHYHTH